MLPVVDEWACKPGGWDTVNVRELFRGEELFGFPIVYAEPVELPDRFVNWPSKEDAGGVHFFTDDYRFERVWRRPEKYIEALEPKVVLGFDFSTFYDWPLAVQIWNVYRNRYLVRFFQSRGVRVIPTISWSDPKSYGFAFAGIEEGSQVSITSVGSPSADWFEAGFRQMVRRIDPIEVIVIGPKLPEHLTDLVPCRFFESGHFAGMISRRTDK